MRRMHLACLRMIENVRNYLDEVHKKTAAFINRNFDVFIIPPFKIQSMMKKEKSDGKKRKLNATSVTTHMFVVPLSISTYLQAVMGNRAVVCGEHYTSKTCGKCGRINHQLISSKTFICRFEGCGFRADRDVSASRNIVMKNFIAGLACVWKHTGMWPPRHENVGKDLPEGVETAYSAGFNLAEMISFSEDQLTYHINYVERSIFYSPGGTHKKKLF